MAPPRGTRVSLVVGSVCRARGPSTATTGTLLNGKPVKEAACCANWRHEDRRSARTVLALSTSWSTARPRAPYRSRPECRLARARGCSCSATTPRAGSRAAAGRARRPGHEPAARHTRRPAPDPPAMRPRPWPATPNPPAPPAARPRWSWSSSNKKKKRGLCRFRSDTSRPSRPPAVGPAPAAASADFVAHARAACCSSSPAQATRASQRGRSETTSTPACRCGMRLVLASWDQIRPGPGSAGLVIFVFPRDGP
jgi:hypothetical protein